MAKNSSEVYEIEYEYIVDSKTQVDAIERFIWEEVDGRVIKRNFDGESNIFEINFFHDFFPFATFTLRGTVEYMDGDPDYDEDEYVPYQDYELSAKVNPKKDFVVSEKCLKVILSKILEGFGSSLRTEKEAFKKRLKEYSLMYM